MPTALERLASAAMLFDHEATTLELAMHALAEVCPRALTIGMTTRGKHAEAVGIVRLMHDGAIVLRDMPHLVHVRQTAYDVADVPEGQRNRWVEPFREGIATHEGFRKSTIYPLIARFRVMEQGRIAICSGPRQVALVGCAIPEGTVFTDAERAALIATSAALVVPLRIAAAVAAQMREATALERLLEGATDALAVTDARGEIVATSRSAFALLRAERELAVAIRDAVRRAEGEPARVTVGARTLFLTPRTEGEVGFLVAIDAGYVEPPIALTPRQQELLALLEKGLTNAQIASAMAIAAPTVKTMIERLLRRASVTNRVELAGWWRARR